MSIKPHMANQNHLLFYEGPFFIDLLTIFGNYLKLYTNKYSVAQKKLFKIYVELVQNVANYAEESYHLQNEDRHVGIGEFFLSEKETHYRFTTKNIVKARDAKILSQRCDIINNSDYEQLKELKRELRKTSPGAKYGARIGLVHAKIISGNNLDYVTIEKNRYRSIFKITAKVDKL
ncbi:MAG: SiaB family protein kinase [Bacteroidota bacterium]